jgi:hypothetical protein
MKYLKAYVEAWFALAALFSPFWISVWIFWGLMDAANIYILCVTTVAAIAGPIKILLSL